MVSQCTGEHRHGLGMPHRSHQWCLTLSVSTHWNVYSTSSSSSFTGHDLLQSHSSPSLSSSSSSHNHQRHHHRRRHHHHPRDMIYSSNTRLSHHHHHHHHHQLSGSVAGRRTCDLRVAGSRPGRDAAAQQPSPGEIQLGCANRCA